MGGSGHNFTQSFQDLNDASSYYHDSLLVDDSGYEPGANTSEQKKSSTNCCCFGKEIQNATSLFPVNDGMGTTLNFDFLLEPRDYCDHRNEERRDGRRGASSGGRVSRKDKQRGASTGLSTDINHHLSAAPPGVGGEHYHSGGINVKRSRSFYAAPGLANRYFFLWAFRKKSIGRLCRLCQSDTVGLIYKSSRVKCSMKAKERNMLLDNFCSHR